VVQILVLHRVSEWCRVFTTMRSGNVFNTDDAFHVYRFRYDPSDGYTYVDGVQELFHQLQHQENQCIGQVPAM
jgi:hypothetical protein